MKTGISIYPGLHAPLEENLALLERGARHGITRIFTSLQIPESDASVFRSELLTLLKKAKELHLDVIADISQAASSLLGTKKTDPAELLQMGIGTLRLDDGFTAEDAAALLRETPELHIQLNASTVTQDYLDALLKAGADIARIDALHNYYPHENTGLDTDFFLAQNELLHRYGISVGAFVATIDPPDEPSHEERRRAPLFCGLPTLEDDRELPTSLAIRHLFALGVDCIFIGDGRPNDNELKSLADVQSNDLLTLHASVLTTDEAVVTFLHQTFTARRDKARDAVRATESRGYIKDLGISVRPNAPRPRTIGAVTLDNDIYTRYTGELQIIRRTLPADSRVNVIAQIDPEEIFLIEYIRPGMKFRLRLD